MKAAPAYLMLITLLSSSFLFSQENISKGSDKKQIIKTITPSESKDSFNNLEKAIHYNKVAGISLTDNNNLSKKNKMNTKIKAVLEVSTSTVPRTTLDFF